MFAFGVIVDGAYEHESAPYMHKANLTIIIGMTTVFEVFYANECYQRYYECYTDARQLLGSGHRFAMYLRVLFPTSPNHANLALRYYLAALNIFFCQVDTLSRQRIIESEVVAL